MTDRALVTDLVTTVDDDSPSRAGAGDVTHCGAASDPGGDRTLDLRIKSPLLYQLSYRVRLCRIGT